jgi:hypothetical protein
METAVLEAFSPTAGEYPVTVLVVGADAQPFKKRITTEDAKAR